MSKRKKLARISNYVISILLIILSYMSHKNQVLTIFFPTIEAIIIFYYFALQKRLSYFFVLLISIFVDAFNNHIIGASALSYFLALFLFSKQDKLFHYKSFLEVWVAFIIFAVQLLLLKWLILLLVTDSNFLFFDLIIQLCTTIIFYPILHTLFHYMEKLDHE